MEETIAVLLSAGLGVTAGWLWGDEVHRRKDAEAMAEHLRLHAPPQSITLKRCAKSSTTPTNTS
jgi:hypothetical protein